MGPKTFLIVQEFLWYSCSAVCGSSVHLLFGGINGDLLQEGLRHRLCDPGSCIQSPCPLQLANADPYLYRREIQSGSVSVGSLGPGGDKGLFELSKCLWLVWGLILNLILPLLPLFRGFSFALTHGVSFLGGTQNYPVDGCSAVICNFGFLTGEEEHMSCYSAILRAFGRLRARIP